MSEPTRTCFVVMGFGKKTDYATGRTLDLDRTYQYIIKPAAEDAGLTCVRADEMQHSGVIDKPMYEQLLEADVVVADLSTGNANAFYELGVRHALRSRATVIIAEKQFKPPFDVNHVVFRPYEHLGSGIDFGEVERMRGELTGLLQTLLREERVDSPVYTFLNNLQPPRSGQLRPAPRGGAPALDVSVGVLVDRAAEARAAGDWRQARDLLESAARLSPDEPSVLQQLALSCYKSEWPSKREGLLAAHRVLQNLNPHHSADPETLGLWAAVHKRLYELEDADIPAETRRGYLDEAIAALERGFYVRQDYYNGINLSYLLDVRAAEVGPEEERIADAVLARRVRRQVVGICQARVAQGNTLGDESFWIAATAWEAFVGLRDDHEAAKWEARAKRAAAEPWMVESAQDQVTKLRDVLTRSPLPVAN